MPILLLVKKNHAYFTSDVRTRMRQASEEVHTFRFQQHSVVLLLEPPLATPGSG